MTTTTTYMTCTEHGEVEVIPSTNGTEYIELCPVCVAVADAESAAAHADAWDAARAAESDKLCSYFHQPSAPKR